MGDFFGFSDESSRAKITIPHWHHFLHEGEFFSMDEPITLGAEESKIYILVTPSSPTNIHFYYNIFVDSEVTVDFYEDTVATDLSGQKAIHNHNRNMPGDIDFKIYDSATISDNGELLEELRLGVSASGPSPARTWWKIG